MITVLIASELKDTDYGLDERNSIPGRYSDFSLPHNVQPGFRSTQPPTQWVPRVRGYMLVLTTLILPSELHDLQAIPMVCNVQYTIHGVPIRWLALTLYIRKVSDSIPSPDAGYPNLFRGVTQTPQANTGRGP
jgi:hypothetical protein